jgi:hypothetical protein
MGGMGEGQPEMRYTRIYRIRRRWVDSGCMDAIFTGTVSVKPMEWSNQLAA